MAARASIKVVRRCWPSTSSQRFTPAGLQGRAGGDDHRAHEVRAGGRPVRHRLALREQVAPQLRQLLAAPAVGPLIQRNLELLLALDKIEKAHLMRAHATSTPS